MSLSCELQKFISTVQHVMERISFVQRARVDPSASVAAGSPSQPPNNATQVGVDLQQMRSSLLHELPMLSEVLRRERETAQRKSFQGST